MQTVSSENTSAVVWHASLSEQLSTLAFWWIMLHGSLPLSQPVSLHMCDTEHLHTRNS